MPSEFLKTPEEMAAYLDACFEEDAGDGVLIRAASTISPEQRA